MPTLTPEQDALKQAALDLKNEPGESFGNKVQVANRYQRLANPTAILAILAQLEAAQAVPDGRYDELIYAVARKFPGETRHETALRYIRQAEANANSGSPAAAKSPPGELGQ
jgi:hypothetical protein